MSCASSAPTLTREKGKLKNLAIDNQQVTHCGRVLLNPASATKMLGSLLFMKIPSISRNMTGTETGHNFIV